MNEELKELRHSKDEADRKKAIELLKVYLAQYPKDVEAWFSKACCYDFVGQEKEAETCYDRVYELGWEQLAEKDQKSFFVGYGSTLRNNLKFDKSVQVLEEGIEKFPEYPAFKAFIAFTYYSLKNDRKAAQILFHTLLEGKKHGFDGYEGAISWYIENLDSYPEIRG